MAVLTASFVKDFMGGRKAKCLFCESSAELKDGELTSHNLVVWWSRNELVLCRDCVRAVLPGLFADVAQSGNEDADLREFERKFWRARTTHEAQAVKAERRKWVEKFMKVVPE